MNTDGNLIMEKRPSSDGSPEGGANGVERGKPGLAGFDYCLVRSMREGGECYVFNITAFSLSK